LRVLSINIFGKKIKAGEKITFPAKVGEFADGTPISLIIRVAVGARNGPRLAMLGVQHGDEYSGMEIINRIIDTIDCNDLDGTIISIPVSNPLAFNAAERAALPSMGYENLNMNRVWPGDSKGLLIERIAARVWGQVITGSDIVIDLHEGGKAFMAKYIHARGTSETNSLVGEKVKEMYRQFGQGVPVLGGVNTRPAMMGALAIQAGLIGVPVLSPELGGAGRLWENLVTIGVNGIKNVLIGLNMIQAEPIGQDAFQYVSDGSSWPKSEHGGVLYNTCELGAVVEKGECLGVLKDTAGRILEELYAPYHSIIFDTRWQPTIYPGDWTYHCGRLP
jgi:predicted deacylase